MKPHISSLSGLMAASLSAAVLSALPLTAEPAAQPATTQSVFIMPANPGEGHDPFFPDSSRPYESAATPQSSNLAETLSVKGVTRVAGLYFVIIGNHTYSVGDEGEVKTSGGSVHIHVVEINASSCVVEVNGQRHELTFSDNP
jgi:hypothetical protein